MGRYAMLISTLGCFVLKVRKAAQAMRYIDLLHTCTLIDKKSFCTNKVSELLSLSSSDLKRIEE